MNFLIEWDRKLFLILNGWSSEALDRIMLSATDLKFWIPFYLWFIYILFKKLDTLAWIVLIGVALTVLIADQTTSFLIKPFIARLRPSHDPELKDLIHLVKVSSGEWYRGGKYGFPSSHAANAFGVATFLWMVLRKIYKPIILAFPIAFLISYTRIYLGVHFPLDILIGAVIGILAAMIIWPLYKRLKKMLSSRLNLENHQI